MAVSEAAASLVADIVEATVEARVADAEMVATAAEATALTSRRAISRVSTD